MKCMKLLEHKWHSINSSHDDSDDHGWCCPRTPCAWQMLHQRPLRELLSHFHNRNKMSFIPKEKEEEQKQRNTWVAFGLETQSPILAEAQR